MTSSDNPGPPGLRPRIAVVTAIAGGKDGLASPARHFPGVDHVAFIDDTVDVASGWDVRSLPRWSSDSKFGARRDAKLPKILTSLVLPGYDFYVWHDATHDLLVDPLDLVRRFLADPAHHFAVFRHGARRCLYDEAGLVLRLKLDEPENVRRQVRDYRRAGFPSGAGLFELPVILRRGSSMTPRIELAWWEQICRYSSRDQLSFPYVCWMLGVGISEMQPGTAYFNEFVRHSRGHRFRSATRSWRTEFWRRLGWKWRGLLRRLGLP